MSDTHKKSEQGQAIVYLVLGLIVFFGFVALAIDGGMALADRRNSQNVADAAALAGAAEAATILEQAAPQCYTSWSCTGGGFGNGSYAMNKSAQAAHDRAEQNGFDLANNLDGHNGVDIICNDDDPNNKYIEVTVEISATTRSNFLQLIFPNALHNEVDSVTRVTPREPIWLDAAVIALNPEGCSADNGITVTGNGTITVSGGGMFSNGCVQGGGTPASAVVLTGTIESHFLNLQNTSFTPTPTTTGDLIQPAQYYIPPPALDASGDCIGGHNVTHLPKDPEPGLWCLTGNDTISQDTTGIGVTIYLRGGHLNVNGGAVVDLEAPTDPHASPEIPNVLIYADNGANITVNGDSSDLFVGLIYAPDSPSQITMNGSADNVFQGQVIGWNVKINGSNTMSVVYDDCTAYASTPSLKLFK